MTWVARLALTAIALVLIRSLWAALGPPWRWPGAFVAAVVRTVRRLAKAVRRPDADPDVPDPFLMLQVQHRLGLLASELRILESEDADLVYYARAHRIHTRRSAYDQLLAEACTLAGVPGRCPGPDGPIRPDPQTPGGGRYRTEAERFSAEIELAARGWHW